MTKLNLPYASQQDVSGHILETIGQTPLVRLNRLYPNASLQLFAKMEAFNPGGSIKDRTALGILQKAIQDGQLQPGATVIESSSGNMAIGLAQACLYFGFQLIVVVDPKINETNVRILQTYGAKIERVLAPAAEGGYLQARLQRVQALVKRIPNSFWPNQYASPNNPLAHHRTMHEIVSTLQRAPDYLFVATSTCGTAVGCAQYLKNKGLPTKVVAVDAVGSVIFGTPPADRLIPGHGAGRPSQLLEHELIHQVVHISDQECVIGCHRLLQREAILCGGSTGAIVMAVEKMRPQLPLDATCALICCDRGERYLDTIYSEAWIAEHFGDLSVAGTVASPQNAAA